MSTLSPRILGVLCVLGGCGGGGPEHWKDQPIETVQGSFEGHAYTIEIPKGMKKSDITKSWDDYSYHAKRGGEDYVFAPNVSVSWNTKKQSLDEALGHEKNPVVRKEQLSDGFIFVLESEAMKKNKSFTVDLERYVGDGALTCHARVWEMAKGEDVKGLVPAVEKMCLSLKAK
jgi:hypothetical protein